MSRLGRIGLFLNLALGLCFAVWGFGLYSNRMDWKAESKERQDQLRKLGDSFKKVVAEAEETRPLYGAQDARRPNLDKWYAAQLASLRNGKDKPKALVYNKGVLQYDPQGMPRLGEVLSATNQPINGLASLDSLDKQYAELHEKIRQAIAEENKLLDEEKKLTLQMNGEGAQKGMRGDLASRLAMEQKSLERQEYVMPFLYNRQAELEVLKKRHEGLEARLKELQGSNVVSRP